MSYRHFFEILFIFLLLFSALAFGGIEPGPVTVSALVVLVLLIAFILAGLRKRRLRVYYSPMVIPLFVFLGLCVVQICISTGNPVLAHQYPHTLHRASTRDALILLMSYLAFFFTAIHTLKGTKQTARLITIIIVFGFLLSVFSIIQKLSGTPEAYWIREMPKDFYGPFFNPNNAANYLMVVFLLNLGYVLYLVKLRLYRKPSVPNGPGPGISLPQEKHPVHSERLPLFVFFLVIIFSAIEYSGSRGGIIITAFASAVLGVSSFYRRIPRAVAAAVVALLLVAGAVAGLAASKSAKLYRDGEPYGDPSELEFRPTIWKHTATAIGERPIFGSGLGTYRERIQKFLPWDYPYAKLKAYLTHAHNDYLELLSDTGLVGFTAFMVFVTWFVVVVLRRFLSTKSLAARSIAYPGFAVMLAMGVHSLLDFNLRIPANGFLFTAICAMTFSALHYGKNGETSSGFRRIRVSRTASAVAQVLTIVLGLVIACLVIFPLAAEIVDPIRSDSTAELGRIDYLDNEKLIRRLEVATKLDCLSGFHRFHLAKAREARVRELMSEPSGTVFDSALLGKINAVYADYGRAIELHPTDGYYRMNLAFFTMLFVDYPEMWEQVNAGAAATSSLGEGYPLKGENRFLHMCYDHMLLAVRLDPNNPTLHRGHYMVCFYLFRRMQRDGETRMAERLLLDGKEACRRFLAMSPTYVGDDWREHSSAEEALRWFIRHVSTDRETMASLLPDGVRNRDALIDRIVKEHRPRGGIE